MGSASGEDFGRVRNLEGSIQACPIAWIRPLLQCVQDDFSPPLWHTEFITKSESS